MVKISVSATIGSVSAKISKVDKPVAIFAFAHGAGAGMNHPFMSGAADELAKLNIATLRFNFPFTELKKGRPDVPAVAHKTIEAAIGKAEKLFPKVPILAGGKSFGGRMSSQYMSLSADPRVRGLVFFGFPLHAPGKASSERAEHLRSIAVPMCFLQGTRDDLAKWELMEPLCKSLPTATLVRFEGANHSFRVPGNKNILTDLAEAVGVWLGKIQR